MARPVFETTTHHMVEGLDYDGPPKYLFNPDA